MPTDLKNTSDKRLVLEFKSSTFSVPVLVLFSNSLQQIEQQLNDKIAAAPDFFKNSPVMLDLHELNARALDIALADLVTALRALKLLPVGVSGGSVLQNEQAVDLGLPVHVLHGGTPLSSAKSKADRAAPADSDPEQTFGPPTLLITQPVRSGQRIYAHGDLIVLAPVNPGTEIMAEGNIHVYGCLRGRALAGAQGDESARIFCSDLQAELVSIAGIYKISEDLDEHFQHKPVQIFLRDQSLIIKDI